MTARTTFHRWVGGPDGHLEDLGTVTLEPGGVLVFDPPSLYERVSEPRFDRRIERKLSPDTEPVEWFNALGLHIWRGSDTAVAYGAEFADPTTMLGPEADKSLLAENSYLSDLVRQARLAICPRCGETKTVPLIWGKPTLDAGDAYRRGEVDLGGCLPPEYPPDMRCASCGHSWVAGS